MTPAHAQVSIASGFAVWTRTSTKTACSHESESECFCGLRLKAIAAGEAEFVSLFLQKGNCRGLGQSEVNRVKRTQRIGIDDLGSAPFQYLTWSGEQRNRTGFAEVGR